MATRKQIQIPLMPNPFGDVRNIIGINEMLKGAVLNWTANDGTQTQYTGFRFEGGVVKIDCTSGAASFYTAAITFQMPFNLVLGCWPVMGQPEGGLVRRNLIVVENTTGVLSTTGVTLILASDDSTNFGGAGKYLNVYWLAVGI